MQLRLRSLNVERAYTLFFCWEEVIVTVTELAPMTSSFLVPAPSRSAPASAPKILELWDYLTLLFVV